MIHHLIKEKLEPEEIYLYRLLFAMTISSTPFHNYNFLQAINNSFYNVSLKFLIVKENKEIIAILPFFQKKYLPFSMISLVNGCYGGFLYRENHKDDLKEYITKNKFTKILTVINSYDDGIYDNCNYLYSNTNTTWIIKCPISYDMFFNKIHSKTRNQIKKSFKENVIISNIGSIKEVNDVYDVYKFLIKKHDIQKPYSLKLFEELFNLSKIDPNIHFIVAKHNENIIAYSVFIQNRFQVFYWLNASSPNFLKLNGTNAILNHMIKFSIENKIDEFNFGAVPIDNNGLSHFKKRWGAIEKRYNTYASKVYKLIRG